MMVCPLCREKTKVLETIHKNPMGVVKRRRECKSCLTEYHTEERIDYSKLSPYLLEKLHLVAEKKKRH